MTLALTFPLPRERERLLPRFDQFWIVGEFQRKWLISRQAKPAPIGKMRLQNVTRSLSRCFHTGNGPLGKERMPGLPDGIGACNHGCFGYLPRFAVKVLAMTN